MSISAAKVLVIGLDSADPGLLTTWMDAGELPALQSLRRRGVWGPLRSPPAMGDDATWASFYTGVSPVRHGRFFFHAFESGAYESPFWQEKHLQYRPFWETLSAMGRRLAVIDVPKCPLFGNINGVHITDWRVHGRDRGTQSRPSAISAQLKERFGEDLTDCLDHRPWLCDPGHLPDDRYDELIAGLLRSIEDKLVFSQELLAQGGWDLFLVVLKEAHCVSHKLWHLLDSTNPAYSPDFARHHRDGVKTIFKQLDAAVARLLDLVGPECHVILFSNLGMASNYTGNFLLDEILRRLEGAHLAPLDRAKRRARELIDATMKHLGRRSSARAARRHRLFFSLPNGEQSGAIRLNLLGRETNGLVRPLCASTNRPRPSFHPARSVPTPWRCATWSTRTRVRQS